MLADAALIDQQTKVHALGLNWTHMPSPTLPMAILIFTDLEPAELPAALSLKAELLDSEYKPTGPTTPDGRRELLKAEGVQTATPVEGAQSWDPVRVPWSIAIGPMPLEPGNYLFRVTVSRAGAQESKSEDVRFRVRPVGE